MVLVTWMSFGSWVWLSMLDTLFSKSIPEFISLNNFCCSVSTGHSCLPFSFSTNSSKLYFIIEVKSKGWKEYSFRTNWSRGPDNTAPPGDSNLKLSSMSVMTVHKILLIVNSLITDWI